MPLTHHFEKIIKILMRKEEMYLTYIKFKNFYLMDINTGEILCDMMSLRVKKGKLFLYFNIKIFRRKKQKKSLKTRNYGKKYDTIVMF